MTQTESNIQSSQATQKLAIDGGPKAVGEFQGKAQPKIGVEEFFSIAKRFGFNEDAMNRLKQTVTNDDLPEGGPNLARYWSTYPKPAAGDTYQQAACKLFNSRHALATSSGTGALHAAMAAVGAAPGKEVIVPATGFIATAMAAALMGATPVFCDVDESFQMDPAKLEACITPNTVAIAPTHHWGVVADMDPIMAIAKKHNLKVVEDCAQSPGAKYKGRYVGTIGDLGCFSIAAYKIIGGGEGGLILCQDDKLFARANQLAESGGLWRKNRFAPAQYPGELFVGTNYRPSELESAVNIIQLQKLPGLVEKYRTNFFRIASQLIRVKEVNPQKLNDAEGIIGYSMRMIPKDEPTRQKLVAALKAEGVGAGSRGPKTDNSHDWHLCTEMYPLEDVLGPNSKPEACTTGQRIYRSEISMSISQWWNEHDCDMVAAGINKVLKAVCTPDENGKAWC